MQTLLVHTRAPRTLLRDLGVWRTTGLLVLLGGMILSALVHPLIYLAAAADIALGNAVLTMDGAFWPVCWFNLAAGHASGIALGLMAAHRSQGRIPYSAACFVPLYWLLISFMSYRALWDFYKRPYYWEKTPHAARPVTAAQETAYS